MAKKEIVRVVEFGDEHLAYRDETYAEPECISAASGLTIEELADFCDQGAEDCNAHDFVGAHRILAAMLFRKLGRDVATSVMLEIAEHGGLDAMNGVCTDGTAYEEYCIAEPWGDWKLE